MREYITKEQALRRFSYFGRGNEIAPTINIDSDFICREAIAEMHRKEIEK